MNQKLNTFIADESFQRWLSGTASSSEKKRWNRWLTQSSQNQCLYQKALDLWKASKFHPTPQPDVEKEWHRLQNRIHLEGQRHTIYSFKSNLRYSWYHKRKVSYWFVGATVAASIAIVLLYQFVPYQYSKKTNLPINYQYVTTEYGQRATIKLSDGTCIILNANSTLGYPAVWDEETPRTVELTGEAYFHVTKRPTVPNREFIVKTAEGHVKVLGTKFTVYERGKGTRVVLEEGSVEITALENITKKVKENSRTILKPGQLVNFYKNTIQDLQPREVSVDPYISWWHQQFILNKTPFKDVVERIEETYDVKVIVSDPKLLEKTLSGTVENQNLSILAKALGTALKVDVQFKEKTIIFLKK